MMNVDLIHDLRLPLQIIASSARMLRLSVDDASIDADACLALLMDSVGRLDGMLSAALSRGDRAVVVDIVARLRDMANRCRPAAAERGVSLLFSRNTEALNVLVDPDLLSRAVLNLVMNALRFTPSGGTVKLRCAAMGDYVEVSVADQGPGIAPERLPYIFLRGETDGGTGYGLPAAEHCVRAMGGELSVAPSPEGGSLFTLRLPVRAARVS